MKKDFVVIFDLDGTLFKTREVVLPAVKNALEDAGLPPVDETKVISLLGEKTTEFCRQLAPDANDEQLSLFIERLGFHEMVFIQKYGVLFEGAENVLKHLKTEGYQTAICSNGSKDYVEFVLYSMDIMKYFDYVSCGEKEKPKKDMIRNILDNLKVKNGVMVGDSNHDISGAAAVGIPSVGVSYGYGDITDATYKINSEGELPKIVKLIVENNK